MPEMELKILPKILRKSLNKISRQNICFGRENISFTRDDAKDMIRLRI